MRRYADRAKGRAWLRIGLMSIRSQDAWPLWFVRLLSITFPQVLSDSRTRRAYRAAWAARSILEEAPESAAELWVPGARVLLPELVRSKLRRTRYLSPRYAAHLAAILIVAATALASGDLSWAGVLQIDGTQTSAAVSAEDTHDQQVRWEMSPAQEALDSALTVPAVREPQTRDDPAFVETHRLAEGETLGELASRYRVSVASLFWANDLQHDDVLAVGQELRIPRVSGIPHVIKPGETIDSIADLFHVTPAAITLFKANGVGEDRPLPVGREIFIPGGMLPYPSDALARHGDEQGIAAMSVVAAGIVQEADTNLRVGPGRGYARVGYLDAGRRLKLIARHGEWVKVEAGTGDAGWVRADLLGLADSTVAALAETNDFPPLPPRWSWPTNGSITSPFGWRLQPFRSFHDGLDIANSAGTIIRAARAGQVIEAGWCSGFGYCVKIDHGDGITTIYGHMLKKPPVAVGDVVDAGDVIGLMGSSFDRSGGGYSTGVHLHFTIKVNGKAVDPLKFLP